MNHKQPRQTAALIGALVVAALVSSCSGKSGIEIDALTLGAAPPGAPMRAGYLTLINHDDRPRVLTHARSDAYGIVEFHITETVDGVARMRQEKTLTIDAGSELRFEPYGRHLMLMRPTDAANDALTIELCFADGECVTANTSPTANP